MHNYTFVCVARTAELNEYPDGLLRRNAAGHLVHNAVFHHAVLLCALLTNFVLELDVNFSRPNHVLIRKPHCQIASKRLSSKLIEPGAAQLGQARLALWKAGPIR